MIYDSLESQDVILSCLKISGSWIMSVDHTNLIFPNHANIRTFFWATVSVLGTWLNIQLSYWNWDISVLAAIYLFQHIIQQIIIPVMILFVICAEHSFFISNLLFYMILMCCHDAASFPCFSFSLPPPQHSLTYNSWDTQLIQTYVHSLFYLYINKL